MSIPCLGLTQDLNPQILVTRIYEAYKNRMRRRVAKAVDFTPGRSDTRIWIRAEQGGKRRQLLQIHRSYSASAIGKD